MQVAFVLTGPSAALKDMPSGQPFQWLDSQAWVKLDDDDGHDVSIVRLSDGHRERVANADSLPLIHGVMVLSS